MPEQPKRGLSQPLTFGGAAGFAFASFGWLALFQLTVALLSAAVIILFFENNCVPVLRELIIRLPEEGRIQGGVLVWPSGHPVRVATGKFLWIIIDPADAADSSNMADLQVEFGPAEVRLRSLFGYVAVPYPRQFVIELNRTGLEPWWGAWHPAVLAILGAGVVVGLTGIWAILGLLYAWPIRLLAFYADRKLSWVGAWKAAAASLLPGALFFAAAILAYALGRLNLVQLIFASILHLMIGWIYVLFVPFSLPRKEPVPSNSALARNPFGRSSLKSSNPFSRRTAKPEQ